MHENQISKTVLECALRIHRSLGPGLLESAYEAALVFELRQKGMFIQQQHPLPFYYREVKQEVGYRVDIMVEKKVVIEVKSVDQLAPIHYAQLLTYLKLSKKKLGLLINFNSLLIKDGFHRLVNNL